MHSWISSQSMKLTHLETNLEEQLLQYHQILLKVLVGFRNPPYERKALLG